MQKLDIYFECINCFIKMRSSSCVKISIAELVEGLNDDGCINVLRLLQHELGHITLNKTIIHILLQCAKNECLTNNSLIAMENKIKEKYHQHQQGQNKTISTINCKDNNNHETRDLIFPLLRLPVDLITTAPSFLNEKDIFKFEQCCRLFYKMINNTSYLNKCSNFKKFNITKKRLNEMKQSDCSFFKYSKASRLHSVVLSATDASSLTAWINDLETTINRLKKMASYDNWLTNLFGSISILDLRYGLAAFLSQMPIDILFNSDPNISHLQEIFLGHDHCITNDRKYRNTWDGLMNKNICNVKSNGKNKD